MRLIAGVGITVLLALPAPLAADICGPGAVVEFPLTAILDDEAYAYMSDAYERVNWDRLDPTVMSPGTDEFADVLAERSAALPEALADLPYLMVLAAQVDFDDPLHSLTYGAQASVLPRVVEALERQGLTAEADLARVPLGLYPDWDAGPDGRLQELIDADADVPPGLRGQAMLAASVALQEAAPKVRAAVQALIDSDPGLAASYEAQRLAADVPRRMDHLLWRLQEDCLARWWTPDEADATFAALGPAQRDILLLHSFLVERYTDSALQFFQNPAATMAPQMADLMDRLGLPVPAAGLRTGMAAFPEPYPRNTDDRRAALARLTAADTAALEALVLWADPDSLTRAMVTIAEFAGLMPR